MARGVHTLLITYWVGNGVWLFCRRCPRLLRFVLASHLINHVDQKTHNGQDTCCHDGRDCGYNEGSHSTSIEMPNDGNNTYPNTGIPDKLKNPDYALCRYCQPHTRTALESEAGPYVTPNQDRNSDYKGEQRHGQRGVQARQAKHSSHKQEADTE
jgi:hypothetical protein